MRFLSLPFGFVTLLLTAATLYPLIPAAGQVTPPEKLVVDFTNDESRSVSVRLGSADGITADMNFAVLDSAGRQIAEFYPHEIMTDRFWSGPLERESFAKVRIGDPVIRTEMDQDRAFGLREEFSRRIVLLREERRRRKLVLLEEKKEEFQEQINELDVRSFRLKKEIASLQGELQREKSFVDRDVDDLQEQIGELREERSELASERADLLDRREALMGRSDPPQDRISDLNAQIADLDRGIGQYNFEIDLLRDEITELRQDARELEEEIRAARAQQRELDRERGQLKQKLDEILGEMEKLEKKGGR